MKILVTTICFINHYKKEAGSEIYATYANRLIKSTMENTNFDIRVATNEPDLFTESLNTWPDRASLYVDRLEKNQVQVGPFNQLLKYIALKDIPSTYDYVLYLDCDSGFTDPIDTNELKEVIDIMETDGFNGLAMRPDTEYLLQSLENHKKLEKERDELIANGQLSEAHIHPKDMFAHKFRFYNVTLENINPEWIGASLPCEHILLLKNEFGRIQHMSDELSKFNDLLETQAGNAYIECVSDMEAFEIGISAKLAGFRFGQLTGDYHHRVFKVKYNGSNWERIKL